MPRPGGSSSLQQNRRTVEAVSYGVGLLVTQLEREDSQGDDQDDANDELEGSGSAGGSRSGKGAAADARDALFGHIRQLLEHSFGGDQSAAAAGGPLAAGLVAKLELAAAEAKFSAERELRHAAQLSAEREAGGRASARQGRPRLRPRSWPPPGSSPPRRSLLPPGNWR